MRRYIAAAAAILILTACATPEQQAAYRQAQQRYEQDLQVALAAQCDREAAQLIRRQFDLGYAPMPDAERQIFKTRYTKKLSDPMFQACYKMAWQNYISQQQLKEVRLSRYYDDWGYPFYHPWWW